MQPNILLPQMQPVMQPMQPMIQNIMGQVNPLNFVDTHTKLANLNGIFIQQKFDLLVIISINLRKLLRGSKDRTDTRYTPLITTVRNSNIRRFSKQRKNQSAVRDSAVLRYAGNSKFKLNTTQKDPVPLTA
jgi:hypothetical protein